MKDLYEQGRVPKDGDNPHVYSKVVPFHPFSFLRVNGANTIPEEEKKFLPSFPPPTYLSDKELIAYLFFNRDEIFKCFSLVVDKESGGVKMVDEKLIKTQRNFLTSILGKLGKSMFSANTIGLSLPANMSEPRSMIEGFADFFRLVCLYTKRASTHPEKLERLKLITTGFISSIYLLLRNRKPLNPILGETMQYTLEDGTKVYGEQISHHPPISYYHAVGPKNEYTISGRLNVDPTFKGSYILIILDVKLTIKFKDGHTYVLHRRPNMKIMGLLSGIRRVIVKGPLIIEDKTLKLWSIAFFDYGEKKGMITSEKTVPKDEFEGIIYLSKNQSGPNEKSKRISDLDDIKKEFARLKGSWLERLEINSVNYWDLWKVLPEKIIYETNPLPSDWRFREDLINIRREELDNADAWKDCLEIRQRRDKKLRDQFKK